MPIIERVCSDCGIFINDLYYLMIIDRCWHLSCLKCSDCGRCLEQETRCFTKHGEILCEDDYHRYVCSILRKTECIDLFEDDLVFVIDVNE